MDNKQILDQLFKITKNIANLYTLLTKYEVEGKKDSKQYQIYLELLKIAIDEENKIYDFYKEHTELADISIKKIYNETEKELLSPTLIIGNNDIEEMIQYRILTKLKDIRWKSPNGLILELYNNYELELMTINELNSIEGLELASEIFPLEDKQTDLQIALLAEKEYQNDEYFINIKYVLSLLCPLIEERYLKTNFNNLPATFDQDMTLSKDYNPKLVHDLLALHADITATEAIDEIITHNDEEIEDEFFGDYLKLLLLQLRASALFMDDNQIKKMIEEIDNYNDLESEINQEDMKYTAKGALIELIKENLCQREKDIKTVNQDINYNLSLW